MTIGATGHDTYANDWRQAATTTSFLHWPLASMPPMPRPVTKAAFSARRTSATAQSQSTDARPEPRVATAPPSPGAQAMSPKPSWEMSRGGDGSNRTRKTDGAEGAVRGEGGAPAAARSPCSAESRFARVGVLRPDPARGCSTARARARPPAVAPGHRSGRRARARRQVSDRSEASSLQTRYTGRASVMHAVSRRAVPAYGGPSS